MIATLQHNYYNHCMNNRLKITFYGDFTFGENYQAKYDISHKINILRQKGYDHLFENVNQILENSDYNIINLETALTNVLSSDLEGKKAVLHWNDPQIAPLILKKHKVHAASLGNNHGYDFGEAGLVQSINSLKKIGITAFGAGINSNEAMTPHKKEFLVNDKPFNLYVFGGYKFRQDYEEEFNFYAKGNKSGINLLIPERANNEIKKIKETDPNSYIVMFVHFGFDLQKTVPMQKEMARGFIDAGADAIIGHGPHMINQIEYYKSKPVIYSLGNFIFPANFRGRCSCYNLIARLNASCEDEKIKTCIDLYPIFMDSDSKTPLTRCINKNEIETVIDLLCEEDKDGTLRNSIKVNENDSLGICFNLEIK